MVTTAPYGTWTSPVDARTVAVHDGRPAFVGMVGDEVWWTEPRPAEGGRRTLVRRRPDGAEESVLPAPWNVRSRVLEYGGQPWAGTDTEEGPLIVFSNFDDQRLYACTPDGDPAPRPLTPHSAVAADCAGSIRCSAATSARCGASWRSSPARGRPRCAGCSPPYRSTARRPKTAPA